MACSKRPIISFPVNMVPWKMVARQAKGEEVATALFEDAFGGGEDFVVACLFHGHGTGHRMGGRRAVSEKVLR